jgi:TolA-binding protein
MKKNAVIIFMFFFLLIVGCSKTERDNEYYQLAKKSLNEKKYYDALKYFQKIVDEYPKSKHYKDALLQTGELTQGLVDKKLTKKEAYKKAIEIYIKFQKKYPQDGKAPQALFMTGFLQANELGKLEEAKATYNKFLELYPNSEMAQSAKAELENLGLSPDQILEQKIKNNK